MTVDDTERVVRARRELAVTLNEALSFALGAGLDTEAAAIAALIHASLTNNVNALMLAIRAAK